MKQDESRFISKFNKYQYILSQLAKNYNLDVDRVDFFNIKRAVDYVYMIKFLRMTNEKRWLWLIRNKKSPHRIIFPFEYYCNEFTKIIKLDFNKIESNMTYLEYKEQFDIEKMEPKNSIIFNDEKQQIITQVNNVMVYDKKIEFYTYIGKFVAYDNILVSFEEFVKESKKRRNSIKITYLKKIMENYPEISI